jgi:hypothetical protein
LICVGREERTGPPKIAREIAASVPAPMNRFIVFARNARRPRLQAADRDLNEVRRFMAGP